MGKLTKRIEELEKRISVLEEKGVPVAYGKKSNDIKEWILSLFKDKNKISIKKIKRDAVIRGYSWQVIGKVRREMTNISVEVGNKKNGWYWVYVQQR